MNALIDTNILLDVLLAREPWLSDSQAIWEASDAEQFGGFISAISVPNIFYIARKIAGLPKAHESIAILLDAFDVLPIDRPALQAASTMAGNDFEDNLQLASALAGGMSYIITRNPRDFTDARCPAINAAEFMKRISPNP